MTVQYISPKDNRWHRYYPDMVIQKLGKDGTVKTVMIEIKPASQCVPPKKGKTKKAEKRYLNEVMTYGVNQAKWNAAKRVCEENNWEWKVLTEKELGVSYKPKKRPRKKVS